MASIVPSGFTYIGNYTKLKANRRILNDEGWKPFAQSFLKQTEYIHSTFDVRRSSVFFSIRLAAFQASGGACMQHWGLRAFMTYYFPSTGKWRGSGRAYGLFRPGR
jgi:hypothetical protein